MRELDVLKSQSLRVSYDTVADRKTSNDGAVKTSNESPFFSPLKASDLGRHKGKFQWQVFL